jgi:hypothetical protein
MTEFILTVLDLSETPAAMPPGLDRDDHRELLDVLAADVTVNISDPSLYHRLITFRAADRVVVLAIHFHHSGRPGRVAMIESSPAGLWNEIVHALTHRSGEPR